MFFCCKFFGLDDLVVILVVPNHADGSVIEFVATKVISTASRNGSEREQAHVEEILALPIA